MTRTEFPVSQTCSAVSEHSASLLLCEDDLATVQGGASKDDRILAIWDKATEGATEAYGGMALVAQGNFVIGGTAAFDGARRMYIASLEANALAQEEIIEEEAKKKAEHDEQEALYEAEQQAAGSTGSGGMSMVGTGGIGGMSGMGISGGNAHNHQTQSERYRVPVIEIIDLPQMTGG